ncbi:MAG: IS3 family transposase [Acidimicrobiales bacterium]
MKVHPFIEAEKVAAHSVKRCCELLEVSRAAYYERLDLTPSAKECSDAELADKITAIHTESKGTYGSPRVHQALRKQGVRCGKRRVRRLMRQAGIEGRCKKRWRKTTVVDPAAAAALDLIQRAFGPGAELDRRYVGDITYIATWEGWAYLATVIDLSSRRVVGWSLDSHMRTELVSDALSMALRNRAPADGLIFHSDRGCQYTSAEYGELARKNGVVLSIGRKGECWDNAVAESFFATIKRELIDIRAWPTREGLRRAVFDYIEGWYNVRRLHSSLNYCSPAEYEVIHRNADRKAA